MVGQNVGKYRIVERIGRGGMGTVYRATDDTLGRDVAIKVLNPELNDPELARRFRAEAMTVARLSHPGIAVIYELLQRNEEWLMVMEFVRGETLEHLVERTGALPPARVAELCGQTLTALAHAHRLGVVHRDLKPANIMTTESGAVKIMDFGIARVAGTEHLTTAGFMMGTPAYMAPEQVLGHDVDARSDLYAMGVVLYRLATGKLPFKRDTPFAMAQSQVKDPPTPVALARDGLPPWIGLVVTRALAKAPADRFQTADEFRDTIERAAAGRAIDPIATRNIPPELIATTPPRALAIETVMDKPAPRAPVSPVLTPGPIAASRTSTSNARNVNVMAIGAGLLVVLLVVIAVYRSRTAASVPATIVSDTPSTLVAPTAGDADVVFGDIKMLTVTGKKTQDQDVAIHFGDGHVTLMSQKGGAAVQSLPYAGVARATYVHARAPQWDASFNAPAADLDVPGSLVSLGSLLRSSRHWLTLQNKTEYVILRLSDDNWTSVLDTLEARTGVKVDRVPSTGK